MFFGRKKLLLVLSICQFHSVVFNYSYKYHTDRVMKLISLLAYEKRSYPPRSYTSDEALGEVLRLLAEGINITNDENGDLEELDFTVEESERVELDSDNRTETVETDSERTSSW